MTAAGAPRCNRELLFGRQIGPTVGAPTYELALNGELHLLQAAHDVATWPDRVHQRALAIAAATAAPQVQS